MRYRRANVAGATYFFTVNLAERSNTLLVDYVAVLREAVRIVKQRHPFQIDAFVVLPDHLHALWTLPKGDADFAGRWMLIKAGFSRRIPGGERRSASRAGKGERGIWQRRYWEHLIRDERDYRQHVDYIHFNPVKHAYVTCAADWAHSSIHRYIREGVIGCEWGGDMTPNMEVLMVSDDGGVGVRNEPQRECVKAEGCWGSFVTPTYREVWFNNAISVRNPRSENNFC